MNDFEKLCQDASNSNVDIIDYHFNSHNIKGLYIDGNIAIEKSMTMIEKKCVLAEELGHHYTTTGNILDQSKCENRKQEQQARIWGYNKLIGLIGIVDAYKSGCQNLYEMAEFLEVDELFLSNALQKYKSKYGEFVKLDNYVIYFEPYIAVLELK